MKDKIIYIAPHLSSFVKEDISLLSEDYDVFTNILNWSNKEIVPVLFIKQTYFLLKHINSFEKIIVSFGGYWSLMPTILGKIFNKKVFIILNGTDCCSLPSLNYGNLRKSILRYVTKLSLKYATELLPVSSSLVYTKNKYYIANKQEIQQGYKAFFNKVNTPYSVIPNAINSEFWRVLNFKRREDMSFITVFSERQFYLKGGDLIIELAKRNPQWNFTIVGTKNVWDIKLRNVKFLGFIDKNELLKVYNNSRFYLQLSIFEGFGCSLCEAILCGCIPIGSNVNAIPDIIDNPNNILMSKSVVELEQKIVNSLNSFDFDKSIQNVKSKYSIENRKLLFNEILKRYQ